MRGRPTIEENTVGYDKIHPCIGRERKIKIYGLAKEQRTSANDIVRQAIDLYLGLEKKRQKNV